MYIADSGATTKKKKCKKKRNITDMLRKERKWNHKKYPIKTTKGKKGVEEKNWSQEQGNK